MLFVVLPYSLNRVAGDRAVAGDTAAVFGDRAMVDDPPLVGDGNPALNHQRPALRSGQHTARGDSEGGVQLEGARFGFAVRLKDYIVGIRYVRIVGDDAVVPVRTSDIRV